MGRTSDTTSDVLGKWGEYSLAGEPTAGNYTIEYSDSGEYYIPPDGHWSSGWPDGWSSGYQPREEPMVEKQFTVGQLATGRLTVGQLKQLLTDIPDDVEVWIKLPERYDAAESEQDLEQDGESLTSSPTSVDSNLIEYYSLAYAEDEKQRHYYYYYY